MNIISRQDKTESSNSPIRTFLAGLTSGAISVLEVIMGTRATIKFSNEGEEFFVYRGHDGGPENVMFDLQKVVARFNHLRINPPLGMLPAYLFGVAYRAEQRLQDYELTTGFHGDESYRYNVFIQNGQWTCETESVWD